MADDDCSRRRLLGVIGAATLAGCSGAPSTADDSVDTTDTGTPRSDGNSTTTETPASPSTPAEQRPPPGSGGSWAIPGYDLLNSGYNPDAQGPGGSVERVWGTDVEGIYTMAQLAVHDGRVFTASGESAYGIDVASGETLWTRNLEYLGHHYPVAATDDLAFVPARTLGGSTTGGGSGSLSALDTETGEERWRRTTPITTASVPAGNAVYYGASTGDRAWLTRRSTTDGSEGWRHDLDETDGFVAVFGEPAITDETVVSTATVNGGAGYDSGSLVFALDRATGERRWQQSFGSEMAAAATVSGDRAYVATRGGTVAALSVADGAVLWDRSFDAEIYTTPVTDGDFLAVLLQGELVGVGAEGGSVRWRTDVGRILINSLALTRSTVYVGGNELRALDRASGDVRWSYPIPGAGGGFGGPVVTGETLFVGACVKSDATSRYDDSVYALQRARD
jgi:outer membrane protein assembly factor BamB